MTDPFYFASGEKWDESKFKAYPAGAFYFASSKARHYTWAKDGEVIIQVTGVGPSGMEQHDVRAKSEASERITAR